MVIKDLSEEAPKGSQCPSWQSQDHLVCETTLFITLVFTRLKKITRDS